MFTAETAWLKFCFAVSPARVLCAENPDLVQLKSLLAGLTLPVRRSSSEVDPEEGEGEQKGDLLSYWSCYSGHIYLKQQLKDITFLSVHGDI